jgi:hypothetical protein
MKNIEDIFRMDSKDRNIFLTEDPIIFSKIVLLNKKSDGSYFLCTLKDKYNRYFDIEISIISNNEIVFNFIQISDYSKNKKQLSIGESVVRCYEEIKDLIDEAMFYISEVDRWH